MHQSLILPSPSTITSTRARAASHPPPISKSPLPSSSSCQQRMPYSQRPSTSSFHRPSLIPAASSNPADGSYAAIYEAALDVARAAERASRRKRSRSEQRRWSRPTAAPGFPGVDVDGRRMMESFHSEMSAQNASDAEEQRFMSLSTGALLDHRGRSLQRGVMVLPSVLSGDAEGGSGLLQGIRHEQMTEAPPSMSRRVSLVRGSMGRRKGRRAAGVAFMSFGLLVGWGGLPSGRESESRFDGPDVISGTSSVEL